MELHSKLWIEEDGKLLLSDYRVRLLRLIDEKGSLSAAAVALDLSYRRAWGKLKEVEQNLGMKLTHRTIGGVGGGGSKLTPEAKRLIERYEQFRAQAERSMSHEFARSFEARVQ